MANSDARLLKFILLGDSGVGKTSLLNQYVNSTFPNQHKVTMGADFFSKDVVIDGKLVTLQIWDTVGLEKFQGLGVAFYRGADGCIIVYDTTTSCRSLDKWKNEFIVQACPPDPDSFPFVVVGNKIDFPARMGVIEEAQRWCERNDSYQHFETSAKDGTNVDLAFSSMIKTALGRPREGSLFSSPLPNFTNDVDSSRKNTCYC